MSSETIFFSYSRADSAFVLKLAKDLRNAGFNIWLDQLDIRPGSRWDDAIQSALNESKILIVILSTSSVASENVMDEVSFAIGNKKSLIPVLLNECITPFRLSRFQRVDFTGDYDAGLSYLVETLDYHGARKREDANMPDGEQPPRVLQTKADTGQQKEQRDAALWQEAVEANSIASYTKYINESATGLHAEEATQYISKLETEQKNKELEKQLWAKTIQENTPGSYQQFLSEYPNGDHKKEALAVLSKINEILKKKNEELRAEKERLLNTEKENKLWEEATTANTISAYEKYLNETASDLNKEKAQQFINQLEAEQKEKEIEEQLWGKTATENTLPAYTQYVNEYPNGNYKQDAIAAISKLEEIEQKNQEIAAENERALIAEQENKLWVEATEANTPSSYEKYMDETRTGLYKERAQEIINQLKAEQKEKELEQLAWDKAKEENSIDAINRYISQYPGGIHQADASAAIENIEESKIQEKAETQESESFADNNSLQKKKSKKYIYFLIAVVVIGAVVFGAMKMNLFEKKDTTVEQATEATPVDSDQKNERLDSLKNADVQAAQDSITKAKQDSIKMIESLAIGDKYGGGKIVKLSEGGEPGLIVAEEDLDGLFNWNDANNKCADLILDGYSGWRLPDKNELAFLYSNKSSIGNFNGNDYWSSKETTKSRANHCEFYADGYMGDNTKTALYSVRPVRNF